jgi:FixJ family two-component response regulator
MSAMAPKLLMIDDHTGITKVVGLVAVALGMEYKALNVSVFATETFIDYRPDIVIIDMHMPEKDGIDVLDEVMTTGIPTQIVLTSGYGEGLLRLGESIVKFHGTKDVRACRQLAGFRWHAPPAVFWLGR